MTAVFMVTTSSRRLHQNMLNSLMHSTMQFFESTPIGRILNRFSKDFESIEFLIPVSFKNFTFSAFDAITIVIMISITTPLFLTVLVPLVLVFYFLQVKFQNIKKFSEYLLKC